MSLTIPNQFASAGLNTPGVKLDEDYNAIAAYINARNPTVGSIASRPAAGNAGALWVASDQGYATYVDDGATWRLIGQNAITLAAAGTPSTPSAGQGVLFTRTETGLQRPYWLDAGGQAGALREIFFRFSALPFRDVNTTALETSVFTAPASITTPPLIRASTLGLDRAVMYEFTGAFVNTTGVNRGFRLRLKYDTTAIADFTLNGLFGGTGALRFQWFLRGFLAGAGATNAQLAHTVLAFTSSGGTAGVGVTVTNVSGAGATWSAMHEAVAVDSTVDKPFDLTIQPEVSAAGLAIRVDRGWLGID